MDKFLFTDGINEVKEVQSSDELEILIKSATESEKIRIWLFSTNEWISITAYRKYVPAIIRKEKPALNNSAVTVRNNQQPVHQKIKPLAGTHWFKKILYVSGAAAGVFLIFNFTKVKWEKAEAVTITATRPANVPIMDIDSLIWEIEEERDQSLDRNTKNNLRLRNTWPERILLQLKANKETSSAGSRFSSIDIFIDNTTGFNLDNAVVRLSVWKNEKISLMDTVRFSNIRFDKLAKRQSEYRYQGDSISVAFESIKAKAFNFCYSAATKNNSGNYNDRWFCRE